MSYSPLSTSEPAEYPPRSHNDSGPPYPFRATRGDRRRLLLKVVVGSIGCVFIFHYVILGALPTSAYSRHFRPPGDEITDALYEQAKAQSHEILEHLDPAAGQPGTFFRDARPIRSMLAFWELAEKEVGERQLDTCQGQLGRDFIEAYHRSHMAYCLPSGEDSLGPLLNLSHSETPSRIWCSPVHRDSFSKWWPHPAAPCFSTNIRAVQDDERKFIASGCQLTGDGAVLFDEMGTERFLGSDLQGIEPEISHCKDVLDRTFLVIGRQDQWNPFHVAEDLVTTLVTVFMMARAVPALIDTRVQLVFAEGFGMDANHFTPLWDRMGAWAPRRLSLDPWGEDVCLTRTIHSVGAGASLLSAMGVGNTYSCVSTITWAAAHYYRHLFGLLPSSLTKEQRTQQRPINVLWLSRVKLDNYAQKHNDWSQWRGIRHITNEPALIKRLRSGLRQLCDTRGFGDQGCVFEDAQDVPESWQMTSPDVIRGDAPVPLRFATIDPTVHALETQVDYVAHSSILVSSHGGALGLSLFLPPGQATILELQVPGVQGNWHFQHMASEMGHEYEMLGIHQEVDVDEVWGAVERHDDNVMHINRKG